MNIFSSFSFCILKFVHCISYAGIVKIKLYFVFISPGSHLSNFRKVVRSFPIISLRLPKMFDDFRGRYDNKEAKTKHSRPTRFPPGEEEGGGGGAFHSRPSSGNPHSGQEWWLLRSVLDLLRSII